MSILKDISDAVSELKNTLANFRTAKNPNNFLKDDDTVEARFFERPISSIARKARKSILQFPIVVSESISPQGASELARFVQVRAAEYVRLMIVNIDPIDIETSSKADLVNSIRGASLKDALISEGTNEVSAYVKANIRLIENECKRVGVDLNAPIELALINEATDSINRMKQDHANNTNFTSNYPGAAQDPNDSAVKKAIAQANKEALNASRLMKSARGDIKEVREFIAKEMVKAKQDRDSGRGNSAVWAKSETMDKVNRHQPVILDLEVNYRLAGDVKATNIALGVKSSVHSVPSIDLVSGLGEAMQRDSIVLQFLRLTSGETSFIKDFILNTKVAKERASATTSRGKKVLETLRRQSEWNDRRSNFIISRITTRGYVPPTATIVVTSDDVEKIKSLFGIDYSSPAVVRKLLVSHNLMGFMIMNEPLGLVLVFEDGDDDYDRLPISEIRNRGGNTELKDVISLLARN